MPSFAKRSYQSELLDGDDIPFGDIKRNMQELEVINSRLGGHAITIDGFKKLLKQRDNKTSLLHIVELGCGGGDNLKAIDSWCRRNNITSRYTGIDINQECITYAKSNCAHISNADWIVANYSSVYFAEKPDIFFSSLFCHHFTDEELVFQLKWMEENASLGFFINDLHRHPLAHYSIKWLTRIFSKSYLVKNDAPLSVLRGFTRAEWKLLLQKAGIREFEVEWKWAFRWLVSAAASDNK